MLKVAIYQNLGGKDLFLSFHKFYNINVSTLNNNWFIR